MVADGYSHQCGKPLPTSCFCSDPPHRKAPSRHLAFRLHRSSNLLKRNGVFVHGTIRTPSFGNIESGRCSHARASERVTARSKLCYCMSSHSPCDSYKMPAVRLPRNETRASLASQGFVALLNPCDSYSRRASCQCPQPAEERSDSA